MMGLAVGSAIQVTSFWMSTVVLGGLGSAGNNDAALIAFGLSWCFAACTATIAAASIARRLAVTFIVSSSIKVPQDLANSFCIEGDDDEPEEHRLDRAMARLERLFIGGAVSGIFLASTMT
jgi:hypothetical protein